MRMHNTSSLHWTSREITKTLKGKYVATFKFFFSFLSPTSSTSFFFFLSYILFSPSFSPHHNRSRPTLPAVQRGGPELWDPSPVSLRCPVGWRGQFGLSRSVAASGPSTSPAAAPGPASPLPDPHRLRHQREKLTSARAPEEWGQAHIAAALHLAHAVEHAVAGATGGQE